MRIPVRPDDLSISRSNQEQAFTRHAVDERRKFLNRSGASVSNLKFAVSAATEGSEFRIRNDTSNYDSSCGFDSEILLKVARQNEENF